ncbi:hypothetical protein Tco_0001125 [Tanacetum coccineum]
MLCKHVVATNWNMALNGQVGYVESWAHPCYWLKTWKEIYKHAIQPINGNEHWEKSTVPIQPKHHILIVQVNIGGAQSHNQVHGGVQAISGLSQPTSPKWTRKPHKKLVLDQGSQIPKPSSASGKGISQNTDGGIQVNVGGAQSHNQVHGGVQAISGLSQPTSPKWTRK